MFSIDPTVDQIHAPRVIRSRTARAAQRLLAVPRRSEQYGIPERSLHDLISGGLLPYVRLKAEKRATTAAFSSTMYAL
jgi:hypothetical protein